MGLIWLRRFFFSQPGSEGTSKQRPVEWKTAAPSEAKRSWNSLLCETQLRWYARQFETDEPTATRLEGFGFGQSQAHLEAEAAAPGFVNGDHAGGAKQYRATNVDTGSPESEAESAPF